MTHRWRALAKAEQKQQAETTSLPSLFTKTGKPKENVTGRRHAKRFKFESARKMRHNPTPAEAALWERIKAGNLQGLRFRRQSILFGWIADFRCPRHRLVVEVDGAYHTNPERAALDRRRDRFMRQFGYSIVRVTNEQVLNDIETVLETILKAISDRQNAAESEACGRRTPSREVTGVTEARG